MIRFFQVLHLPVAVVAVLSLTLLVATVVLEVQVVELLVIHLKEQSDQVTLHQLLHHKEATVDKAFPCLAQHPHREQAVVQAQ
jgi:hypothetical protein